jgi:hypothetical protein
MSISLCPNSALLAAKASRVANMRLVVGFSMILMSSPSMADVCDAVLKYKSFDITDGDTRSKLSDASFDDMCKTEWSSQADYDKSSQSLGLGGTYEDASSYLNLSQADQKSALHATYDHLCIRKDNELRSLLFSKSHIQSASGAVAAWKDCVANQVGLFAALELPPQGTDFQIYGHYREQDPNGKGLTLKGYNKDSGYECKLGDDEISNYNLKAHNIGFDFFLQCKRTRPESVNAVINTNTNDPMGPFTVPSGQYLDLVRQISELEIAKDRIYNRLNSIDINTQIQPAVSSHPDPGGKLHIAHGTCPADTKIIGFVCHVDGGYGNLQTAGIMDERSFNCEWKDYGGPFAATGRAVCVSLIK